MRGEATAECACYAAETSRQCGPRSTRALAVSSRTRLAVEGSLQRPEDPPCRVQAELSDHVAQLRFQVVFDPSRAPRASSAARAGAGSRGVSRVRAGAESAATDFARLLRVHQGRLSESPSRKSSHVLTWSYSIREKRKSGSLQNRPIRSEFLGRTYRASCTAGRKCRDSRFNLLSDALRFVSRRVHSLCV